VTTVVCVNGWKPFVTQRGPVGQEAEESGGLPGRDCLHDSTSG